MEKFALEGRETWRTPAFLIRETKIVNNDVAVRSFSFLDLETAVEHSSTLNITRIRNWAFLSGFLAPSG